MIVFDVIIIIILFSIFAFTHSFFASLKVKKEMIKSIGNKIAFYRLFYNISSLLLFGTFYLLAPKPDVIVYDLHYPYDIITFVLQVLSLIGLMWSIKTIDIKEFLGVSQIIRYLKGNYNKSELDEKNSTQN